MSGIVAMVGTDGAPAQRPLLEALASTMAFRGPDALRTSLVGSVGMGHALLATTPEAAREGQPATLGNDVWITADLRIDGRSELLEALEERLGRALAGATDVELVLHAYRVWGQACVHRLLGDFAFVIWDGPRRTLFCARDPFGMKLLYHASGPGWLVLSNTLGCVRSHPGVSDRLDDAAIGSMLLWGENWDLGTTTFADVRSVPPGHTFTWADGRAFAIRRYWELPEEGLPLRYSDDRDYVDHFRTLLDAAVGDRLRTRSAAVLMSGGLDSPMIAAVAREQLARGGPDFRLSALTVVFDRLIPDQECHWSTLAARHVGFPIHHYAADHLYRSWDWMQSATAPEPAIAPSNAPCDPAYRQAATEARVILTGFDGDAMLDLRLAPLWRARLARGELGSLARELGWHVMRGRVPRVGIRATLGRWRSLWSGGALDGYPRWLSPSFEGRQELRERWRQAQAEDGPQPSPRAGAYRSLASPVWRSVLDPGDPGMSGVPLELRHPLIDLRLIRFALALPPVPWCVGKELFRAAMRERLPAALLRRPKTPLAGRPISAGLAAARRPLVGALTPELGEYVDVATYRADCEALRMDRHASGALAYAAFSTCALGGWLGSPARRLSSTLCSMAAS